MSSRFHAYLPSMLALIGAVLLAAACSSRLHLGLFLQIAEEERTKLKIEDTKLVIDAVLLDAFALDRVEPGEGNVVVLQIGSRRTADAAGLDVFSYDEYWKGQLFFQLPERIRPATHALVDSSLLMLTGRHELSIGQRAFIPQEGTVVIDSLVKKRLYLSVDGLFRNSDGVDIRIDGKLKMIARL